MYSWWKNRAAAKRVSAPAPTATPEVRRARDADIRAVEALLDDAGLPLDGLAETDLWVAVEAEADEVVGSGGLEVHGRTGLLRSVAVAPAERGRGLSRLILDYIEDAARAANLDSIYLLTTDAAGYFQRLGWAPAAREQAPRELMRSPEWDVCPESATLMVKHLNELDRDARRRLVIDHYTALARGDRKAPPAIDAYADERLSALPADATTLRLGCGPITDYAPLRPGIDVLDVGCGAGLDALLCARKIGSGSVTGVDLTPAMIERARTAVAGHDGIELTVGDMEHLALNESSFDLVIANASLNQALDATAALTEALRVLRPGGHLVVSDGALQSEPGLAMRRDPTLVLAGIGGAPRRDAFLDLLPRVGFVEVELLREVAHPVSIGLPVRAVIIRARRPTA